MKAHLFALAVMGCGAAMWLALGAAADRGTIDAQEPPPAYLSASVPAAGEGQQNTGAFTYQGQLRRNGLPVTGDCNAGFKLYDAATGGTQIGVTVTSPTLQVKSGLFTIALDFGQNAFEGQARWLETAVGCGESQVTLTPRVAVRPAPYALALPGMRSPAATTYWDVPALNVIGGIVSGTISNTVLSNSGNSVIAGGVLNSIGASSYESFIGGGYGNAIKASRNTVIGGGSGNGADDSSYLSVIGGGSSNAISETATAAIGGGSLNRIEASMADSTIGGGRENWIVGSANSWIGGGEHNAITWGSHNAIGGGDGNVITDAAHATIPGGSMNLVEGSYSFAAGRQAIALADGEFVWADSTNVGYNPWTMGPGGYGNSLNVRATGGVYFDTAANTTTGQTTAGVYVSGGGSGWNSISDRASKSNATAVDGAEVLKRLADVPILRWTYKSQDTSVQHIGPMAQDFNTAFGVGEKDKWGDQKYINSIDADGVALAAVQALKAENDALRARLEALEQDRRMKWAEGLTFLFGALALGGVGMLTSRRRS